MLFISLKKPNPFFRRYKSTTNILATKTIKEIFL